MAVQSGGKMSAIIKLREKEYEVKPGSDVRHTLQKLGIQPESVLITRKGQLITDDEILSDGDVIKLVSVISGGSE
jgi:sulfur carrier protein ThiS